MKPSIQVFDDLASLSQAAAELFAASAQAALQQRGIFRACLSGGSTPLGMFHLLAQEPYASGLPWGQMVFFWADERLVPPHDPQSNYGQAWNTLFSRVAVPPAQLCRIKGELPPEDAARDTAELLRAQAEDGQAWPRLDLVLLGLGADGHTASLFPGSDPAAGAGQAAIAVTGDYQGRPAQRVTLTPAVFNAARRLVFLAAGADKAAALAATLHGVHDPRRWPAQRIAPEDGEVLWLVDAAAVGFQR